MSTSSWIEPFIERVQAHQRTAFGDPMFEGPPTVEVEAADRRDTRRLVDTLDDPTANVLVHPRWDPRIQRIIAGLIADGVDGSEIHLLIGIENSDEDDTGLSNYTEDELEELQGYVAAGIRGDEEDDEGQDEDDEDDGDDDEDGLSGLGDEGDDEDDDGPGAWTAVGVSDPGRIASEAAGLIRRLGRWGTFAIRRHELTEEGTLRHVVEIDAELT